MLLRLAVCFAVAHSLDVHECLDASAVLTAAKDRLVMGRHADGHEHGHHGPRHRDKFSSWAPDGKFTVMRLAHRSGRGVEDKVKQLIDSADDCDTMLTELYSVLGLEFMPASDPVVAFAPEPQAVLIDEQPSLVALPLVVAEEPPTAALVGEPSIAVVEDKPFEQLEQ